MFNLTYKAGETVRTVSSTDDYVEIISSDDNGRFKVEINAKEDITLLSAVTGIIHEFKKSDLCFANGYQSWTESREFKSGEGLNDLSKVPSFLEKKFAFLSYGSQSFERNKKGELIAFDLMYKKGESPLFIASYNFKNAYLIMEIDRRKNCILLKSDISGKSLNQGESFTVFDYILSNDIKSGKDKYFGSFKPKTTEKVFGYTSWYNHYQNINEDLILTALKETDKRFDLFQIDDGFETYVGDWKNIDGNKFPKGLKGIVDKIHKKGMKAGIWLAPFVAEEKSELFKEHPEFFKKDKDGNFLKAGGNWSGFYALDISKKAVTDYIKSVFKMYCDLGFDFFKLDFLYAVSILPIDGLTRAETAEKAYNLIIKELKGKIILGCGAVLSNAYEKFDYMRIGPDVSLKFDDAFYMRFFHPERISTKVTLQNTVFRYMLNGHAFGNDPDVFLLRDDNISLNEKQRYALTIINALFGSLFMTSDNPKNYDKEKKEILKKALKLRADGKVTEFFRYKNTIKVIFDLDGKPHCFEYDFKKGIIKNER